MLKKNFLIISALSALMIFFQNCQPAMRFTTENASLLTAGMGGGGGNGDGYGGKPGRDFYRFTPDFTCEGKEAAVSVISVMDTKTTYTENKRLMCGAVKTDLDPSLIDRSVYQNDIVGYLEGIFESENSVPTSIPANLVEVWCRDTKDRTGIETITHYDRSTQLAVTRILSAGAGTSVLTIPDFNVSRVISPTFVSVSDGKDFSLKVYRDQPAAQLGLFKGSLEAMVNGQKIKRDTSCRLGGSLDAKVWPAKQIVDMNINMFKISPDLQSFGYTSTTGFVPKLGTSPHLYTGSLLGAGQIRLTPPNTTLVSNFEFTPDSSSLVYWSDQRRNTAAEIFKIGRDGTSLTQLEFSADPDNVNNGANAKLQFSADGSRLVYWDDPLNAMSQTDRAINSVSLNGGSPIKLSPSLQNNYGIFHFSAVSKSLDKVAFFFGQSVATPTSPGTPDRLYISNLDGTGLFQTAIPYPTDGWNLMTDPMDTDAVWSGSSQYVIVKSARSTYGINPTTDILYSAVAADGSGVVSLPINWTPLSSNSSGNIVLLTSRQLPHVYKLMDLGTGHLLDLPGLEPQVFSKDGTSLLATETDASGRVRGALIDVVSGAKTALCPQALSNTSNFQDMGSGKWLVSSWNETSGVLNLYWQSAGQCQLKNSIPLSTPVIKNVTLTPDSQKAVVSVSVTMGNSSHDQLFFVPLNGKPAYQINAPVYIGAKIGNVQVLPDSQSVFYTGDQLKSGEIGAFLWKAP